MVVVKVSHQSYSQCVPACYPMQVHDEQLFGSGLSKGLHCQRESHTEVTSAQVLPHIMAIIVNTCQCSFIIHHMCITRI